MVAAAVTDADGVDDADGLWAGDASGTKEEAGEDAGAAEKARAPFNARALLGAVEVLVMWADIVIANPTAGSGAAAEAREGVPGCTPETA